MLKADIPQRIIVREISLDLFVLTVRNLLECSSPMAKVEIILTSKHLRCVF